MPAVYLVFNTIALMLILLPWLVLWGLRIDWQFWSWQRLLELPMVILLALASVFLMFRLTEFYGKLFNAQFPTSLELGGLFIGIVLAILYPWGILWGYIVGFRLFPAWHWPIGIATCLLWTVGVFFLGYGWALREANKL
ncbi:MAG: hypothetical protein ACK4QL_02540 [Pseudanabaenaceae cyanobacterium]